MTLEMTSGLDQNAGHLNECPVCSYCLRGLPATHRCPECGFRYDGSTVVWQSPRAAAFSALWIYAACLAMAGWCSILFSMTADSARSLVVLAVLAGWMVMAAVPNRPGHRRPFVAASAMGLVMRLRGRRTRTLPWNDIADLKIEAHGDRRFVQVIPTDGGPVIDVSRLVRDAEAAETLQVLRRARPDLPRLEGTPGTQAYQAKWANALLASAMR